MREPAIEMANRLMVDSIWKSASLEGWGTTAAKVEEILANTPTTTCMHEVLYVVNMKRAWEYILNHLTENTSIMLMVDCHSIAVRVLSSYGGAFRMARLDIEGTSWTPKKTYAGIVMDAMLEIEKIEEPELRALKYFCYLARAHVFKVGNKRVAQLIANKVLIENDIGIFQMPVEKLDTFKKMLIRYYETGKDEKIITFMKEHCVKRVGEKAPERKTVKFDKENFWRKRDENGK